MSLTDSHAAVEAAIKAFRDGAMKYTLLDIEQGPGEGNYDRVERLKIEDAIRAAEAVGVDEQDTMVLKSNEGEAMPEKITEIRPYESAEDRWDREAGFQIVTTEQTITLAIDDYSSCCEQWGYFLTEDDTDKFIGAELLGVEITDTNRSNRTFQTGWDGADADAIHLDAGDTMFVDIRTDRGILQFVAYNAHNGYYGHEARVSSTQLTATKGL